MTDQVFRTGSLKYCSDTKPQGRPGLIVEMCLSAGGKSLGGERVEWEDCVRLPVVRFAVDAECRYDNRPLVKRTFIVYLKVTLKRRSQHSIPAKLNATNNHLH